MGGTLSSIKAQPKVDQDNLDDALNSLEALALLKMNDFYLTVESSSDAHLLPINKITGKYSFMQAKAATDSNGLKSQVQGLIKDIAGGHWADAISDAASDVIEDLLGASSASVQERTSYMISVNALGGVERLDVYYFGYSFKSQSLVTAAQNVVASIAVKSSIVLDGLDDNTLRIIVNDSFPALDPAIKAELYEQLAIIILPNAPNELKVAATKSLEQIYENNPIIDQEAGQTNAPANGAPTAPTAPK